MNIVMLTNTFTPHVGGVARSVEAFSREYRSRGHRVMVVAPEFENVPEHEMDVVRIPAIQHFNGSDFSVVLPVSGLLTEALDHFNPDIVHSHHPYLLGMTALRVARYRELPLVFTHHTLYEQYTHYVPGDSPALKRFAIELSVLYANLCDMVFSPSDSIATLLDQRGVTTPVSVVPTGVDVQRFTYGNGSAFRAAMGIPRTAFVVGHLGRLAPEKNLEFLAGAVVDFLKAETRAHFLLVGEGPLQVTIRAIFEAQGLTERFHGATILSSDQLVNAYHAMDVFAFASKSETQGMVLTEAMAAGVPVVGLDAPGVREVIKDSYNGRLINEESRDAFCEALRWMMALSPQHLQQLKSGARKTAEDFSMSHSADKALHNYEALLGRVVVLQPEVDRQWERVLSLFQTEWDIIKGVAGAAGVALGNSETQRRT